MDASFYLGSRSSGSTVSTLKTIKIFSRSIITRVFRSRSVPPSLKVLQMANFAGNLSFKISIELRPRVLLTPWVKTSSFIRCCGDYPSSGPVRYIPKKSSQIDQGKSVSPPSKNYEKSESDHFSDSIPSRNRVSQREEESSFGKRSQDDAGYIFKPKTDAVQSMNKNMFGNVEEFLGCEDEEGDYDDDPEEVDILSKDGNEAVQSMNKNMFGNVEEFLGCEDDEGDYDDPEEVDVLSKDGNESFEESAKLKQDAERLAIQALATRAFTAVELRKKLQGKKIPRRIIDSVLTDFQNRGLINDYLYAESFSQSRWSSSTWGPRRIKQALFQKGVSDTDAKKAMKHVFEGDDSDDEREPNIGMSKLAIDHLFVQASKQWKRGQDVSLEKRKARIVRWLQYRGFNWGVASFILKKLESQYPP